MILAGDIFSAQGKWRGGTEAPHNAALGMVQRCLTRNQSSVCDAIHSTFQTNKLAQAEEILAECRHVTSLSVSMSLGNASRDGSRSFAFTWALSKRQSTSTERIKNISRKMSHVSPAYLPMEAQGGSTTPCPAPIQSFLLSPTRPQ